MLAKPSRLWAKQRRIRQWTSPGSNFGRRRMAKQDGSLFEVTRAQFLLNQACLIMFFLRMRACDWLLLEALRWLGNCTKGRLLKFSNHQKRIDQIHASWPK